MLLLFKNRNAMQVDVFIFFGVPTFYINALDIV
jgi:hypothetical protein